MALAKDGSKYKLLKTLDAKVSGGQTAAAATVSRNGQTLLTAMTNAGSHSDGTTLAIDIPAAYR